LGFPMAPDHPILFGKGGVLMGKKKAFLKKGETVKQCETG